MSFITFSNDGPEIVSTNFWDTPMGRTRYAYGANAGTMRLLIPTALEHTIPDMISGCDYVVVSTVRKPSETKLSIEFLFEDHSDTPYAIHCCAGLTLGFFPMSDPSPIERHLTIWVKGPRKVATLRAYSRRVPHLPWLKPLRRN